MTWRALCARPYRRARRRLVPRGEAHGVELHGVFCQLLEPYTRELEPARKFSTRHVMPSISQEISVYAALDDMAGSGRSCSTLHMMPSNYQETRAKNALDDLAGNVSSTLPPRG